MSGKNSETNDYTSFREDLFNEMPETRIAWQNATSRRQIGLILARIRKEAGLSQVEVAERAGLDEELVVQMEGALTNMPSPETYTQFVEACGSNAAFVVYHQVDATHVQVVDVLSFTKDDNNDVAKPLELLRNREIDVGS
jgi:transcriptional regulator with XRE-family HTH domain